jgi:hypothetical protein
MGFCYVVQAGLQLLGSRDSLTFTSLVAGTAGVHHCAKYFYCGAEDGTHGLNHAS